MIFVCFNSKSIVKNQIAGSLSFSTLALLSYTTFFFFTSTARVAAAAVLEVAAVSVRKQSKFSLYNQYAIVCGQQLDQLQNCKNQVLSIKTKSLIKL